MSNSGNISNLSEDVQHVRALSQSCEEKIANIKSEANSIGRDLEGIKQNANQLIEVIFQSESAKQALNSPGKTDLEELSGEERKKAQEEIQLLIDDTKDSEGLEHEIEQIEQHLEKDVTELRQEIKELKEALKLLEKHESVFRARSQ